MFDEHGWLTRTYYNVEDRKREDDIVTYAVVPGFSDLAKRKSINNKRRTPMTVTWAGNPGAEYLVKHESNNVVTFYSGSVPGQETKARVEHLALGRVEFFTGTQDEERLERAETMVTGEPDLVDVWSYRGNAAKEAYYVIQRKSRKGGHPHFFSYYEGAKGHERLVFAKRGTHYLQYKGSRSPKLVETFDVTEQEFEGPKGQEGLRRQVTRGLGESRFVTEEFEGSKDEEWRSKLFNSDGTSTTCFYPGGKVKSNTTLKVSVFVNEVLYNERGGVMKTRTIRETPLVKHELYPDRL